MIFQQLLPSDPQIGKYVRQLWYIAQSGLELGHTDPKMVPDGCYHIVFNLGSPHCYIDKDGKTMQPKISHMNANQAD